MTLAEKLIKEFEQLTKEKQFYNKRSIKKVSI